MQQNQNRNEVAKLEAEMKSLRKDLQLSRNRLEVAELEVYTLKQYKEVYGDPEILAKVVEVRIVVLPFPNVLFISPYFSAEIERQKCST